MKRYFYYLTILLAVCILSNGISYAQLNEGIELTIEEEGWLKKAERTDINGWIYLKIQGEPFERGFQHGYLTVKEYAEAIKAYKYMTYQSYGMEYSFFVEKAVEYHKSKISAELLEEMKGIAAGYTKAGFPTTVNDVIGWNAYVELTGYWWPTVITEYANAAPSGIFAKSHCSAFIATGSATTDGKIVIGHESFTEFWNGQYQNIILDITPSEGYRIIMQASPGYISSMSDFYLSSAGIILVETTIVGYQGYDVNKIPEYVRCRNACQYANNIEEWVKIFDAGNNGGYANSWLIGDINTNEIARYEAGLVYQSFEKKADGYYYGDNAPFDPRIRNLECTDVGYNDIRQQTGARRMRWPILLNEYNGKIDAKVGQIMLADTYDVYLEKINPSSRTICSHYDSDPMYYVSDPNAVWNIPYYPAGSIDGKVTTSELAKDMSMWGIFGRADGVEFDAEEFLRTHSQWDWQKGYLKSRPCQPWTLFEGTK